MAMDDDVTIRPAPAEPRGWFARIDRSAIVTVSVAAIAIVAVVAALSVAHQIAIPTVLAALAAIALAPLARHLERIGAPVSLAAALIVSGALGGTAGTLYSVTPSAEVWNDRAPQILRNIELRLREISHDLARSVGAAPDGETGTLPQANVPPAPLPGPGSDVDADGDGASKRETPSAKTETPSPNSSMAVRG